MIDYKTIKGTFKLFTRTKGETEWTLTRQVDNLIVDFGLTAMRNMVAAGSGTIPAYGAFSDDTNAPVAGDTALGGNEVRKIFLAAGDTSVAKKVTWSWLHQTTDWGVITSVSKAGIYTGSSGSNLWSAASFTAITVNNTVEMLGQWTYEFLNG